MYAYMYVRIDCQEIIQYSIIHIDLGLHGKVENSEWGRAEKTLGASALKQ